MQDVVVRSELDQSNESIYGFDLSALSKVYSIDPRLQHHQKYFPPVMEAEIAMELSRKRHKYLSGDIEGKLKITNPCYPGSIISYCNDSSSIRISSSGYPKPVLHFLITFVLTANVNIQCYHPRC